MLNEPNADELNVEVANSGGGGGAAPTGAAAAGERQTETTLYLTAQDRDAIERVSRSPRTICIIMACHSYSRFPIFLSSRV